MSEPLETQVSLRTARWYGGTSRDHYLHRSWMKRGLPDDAFSGKPMIGICNSASELAPCNQHLDDLADFVRRGVWEAGGVPLEFPVTSLGEAQLQPTAMLLRNLMAMDVEESLRGNPLDGVVLLSGCDKTTPAMLMGAASVDLPAIMLTGGPMLTGRHRGRPLGSATDMWRMSEEVRAGQMSVEEFIATESSMTRSAGHCNPMGTASTMATMAEALGMTLPHSEVDPGTRQSSPPSRPPDRSPCGRDGAARPPAEQGADPARLRERHSHPVGGGRLDERRDPPPCARRPGRRAPRTGGLRSHRFEAPAAGRHHARRLPPHG